jgi:hypothetical protein
MFQTQGSGSFTAHPKLLAGGTAINSRQSIINFPSAGPWDCDAPPPDPVTSLINASHQYLRTQGPFPCLRYATLRDVLDARK